ncbi:hypothetical protein CGCS363_v011892 [Colletotrichum siamense]|uniref:uncharacterized protein n=1 Tax=Colletotrichum siamense TaxID=690259 RepID=UPI0018724242|nr:uncharacterized protein CGCS363_v011892 [Colletotrichum siamense]KAF5489313.1 hypothetical protein CGCS363_v011892 [Colletotrichum siamense]
MPDIWPNLVLDDFFGFLSDEDCVLYRVSPYSDGRGGGGGGLLSDRSDTSRGLVTERLLSSTTDESRPTQDPLHISIADTNPVCTNAVDLQLNAPESLLSRDVQISQQSRSLRKSGDGLFVVPEIPQKLQHPRAETQGTSVRKGILRSCSNEDELDDERLVFNDRQPSLLRHSKSWNEEVTVSKATRRLACPYLKYEPERFHHRCRGAAYTTIHRLKEHLYRVHKQSPHCIRCKETFTKDSDVKAHLSHPGQGCDFIDGVSIEGLTSEQFQKLKSKKRKPGVTTNEEKWQEIFRIVFPDATRCPDPYYSYFDDRSADQKTEVMHQSDVESIFSDIPSESEDRMFKKLERICGPLEKRKRQKVLHTFENFFEERVQQIRESKELSRGKQSVVHPEKSMADGLVNENIAIETEESIPEAQCSAARGRSKEPFQSIHEIISATEWFEHCDAGWFQGHIDCNLFNLPNETTFSEVPHNGNQPDERANLGRSLDSHNALRADETPFNFDTLIDDFGRDEQGYEPFGSTAWATGGSNF